MLKTVLFIFVALVFMFSGCTIINPAETIPTYIRIDSITYAQDSGKPKIYTDVNSVWVYYKSNPIGVFDLPCTIPVMAKDIGQIALAPGITVLGMNNFMVRYPFYKADTFNLTAQPGKTVVHQGLTHYFPFTKFNVVSDFELGATNFSLVTGTVNIGLTTSDTEKLEGNGSGAIRLKAPSDTLSESTSSFVFPIPANKDAYIELEYKCDVQLFLGMQSNYSGASYRSYLAGLYPTGGKWKKLYMPLRDFVAQYTGSTYQLYIKATLPDGQATGKVLFDNVKLVYSD